MDMDLEKLKKHPSKTVREYAKIVEENRKNKNISLDKFEFRGEGKEFFNIWIVNFFLTLFTLGIYSAWAKVRSNRYIWESTYYRGSNFEYNAKPLNILYGRILVVGLYIIYYIFAKVLLNITLTLIFIAIFIILFPWLMRQAIKFKLKSTSYRNISFSFRAKVSDFYKLFLKYIILLVALHGSYFYIKDYIPLDIAHIIPYFIFVIDFIIIGFGYREYKEIVINNIYYGDGKFNFYSSKKDTFLFLFKIFIFLVVSFFIIEAVFIVPKIVLLKNISAAPEFFAFFQIFIYLIFLVFFSFFKGFLDGMATNFIRNHTTFEEGKFRSNINPFKLGFISVTNLLGIIFTLGFFYPWAKMRYLREKIENSSFSCENLDYFISKQKDEVRAIGEEALDFLDIDIGF